MQASIAARQALTQSQKQAVQAKLAQIPRAAVSAKGSTTAGGSSCRGKDCGPPSGGNSSAGKPPQGGGGGNTTAGPPSRPRLTATFNRTASIDQPTRARLRTIQAAERARPTTTRYNIAASPGRWFSQSAAIANKDLRNMGYPDPPYDPKRRVFIVKTKKDEHFVRVYTDHKQGRWLMRESDIRGLTPRQIQKKFALPDEPTKITNVRVSSGTTIRYGRVRENYDHTGGGRQYELLDSISADSFTGEREIQ